MNHTNQLSPRARNAFAAVLGLIFLLLVFRNTGLYPFIMSDEWSYSSMSRLMPLSQVTVPSYLYFAIFRATSSCGDGFLDCARMFNALALVATAPFIYALAKRVTAPAIAAVVAVLAILAPLNVYTAFFMPEICYYLGFWALTWLVFHFQDRPGVPRALMVGAALGLLAMVKMHALFLLPALCLYMLWVRFEQRGQDWLLQSVLLVLAMLAGALVVRLGVGFLLAGKPALNLIGSLYQGQSDATQGQKPLAQMLSMALGNLRGHLLGLALLSALPLAVLGNQLGSRNFLQASPQRSLAIYALLMVGSMVAVTALFTATVAGNGPFENANRLHLRYYSFTLPLLAMLAASQMGAATTSSRNTRLVWGLLLAAALIYAGKVLPKEFSWNIVDNPELLGLQTIHAYMRLTVLAGAACLALWIWRPQHGGRAFVLLFIPIVTWIGGSTVYTPLRNNIKPDAYDTAGIYARQYLKPEQIDHLAIAGDNHGGLFKIKYHTDNLNPALMLLAPGQTLSSQPLPPGARWLLAFGKHPEMPGLIHLQTDQFTLSNLLPNDGSRYQLDFSQNERNGYLRRTDGLSEAGGNGRWSMQKQVQMEFVKPLPKQLTLTLTAFGFGPNAGQDLVVQVGTERQSVKLAGGPQQATLQFNNGGNIDHLTIIVPQPISPKALGQSADERTLGVFLSKMVISSSDPVVRAQLEHDSSPLEL